MKLSAAGLELLKRAEGIPQPHLPRRGRGVPRSAMATCWGRTRSFPARSRCNRPRAMLERDLVQAEEAVTRLVRVPLTQGQFDALVDFTFNLGAERAAGVDAAREAERRDANAAARGDSSLGSRGRKGSGRTEAGAVKPSTDCGWLRQVGTLQPDHVKALSRQGVPPPPPPGIPGK